MRFIYFAHFSQPNKPRGKNAGQRYKINSAINASEVRVIDDTGNMLGIMPTSQALKLAEEKEIDLVEIAPQAKPPVCKIIDYGKFLYEQQKREKSQKKNQQAKQLKEIRFKWRTDTHDFNFKTKHAMKFIEDGYKVKASVMFRGREIVHKEIGTELLKKFIEEMQAVAKIDQPLKSEGKFISVVLSPDKSKKKKNN